MDSLAGQVQLGSDAIVAKQRDKDIGVCTCAVDVSGDGHHLIDCHVIEHRMHECIINEEDIHTSVNNCVKRPDEQWLRSWSAQDAILIQVWEHEDQSSHDNPY